MVDISVEGIDKVLVIGHTGRPTYKLKAINFKVNGETIKVTDIDIDNTLACLGYDGTPPDSDTLIEQFADQIIQKIREEIGDSSKVYKNENGPKASKPRNLAMKNCAAIVEGGCVISLRVKTKLLSDFPDIKIIDIPGQVGASKN